MSRERWEFSRSLGVFLGCIAGGIVATFGKPGVVLAIVVVLLAFAVLVHGLEQLRDWRERRDWRRMPQRWRPRS